MADIVEIAAGALEGGADGLTLVNTLLGLALDTRTGRPVLGAGGGGLSGPPLHPVAVRAVWECRGAFPSVPIVGVGGVSGGLDAVELLMAGADAVQVGTATFRDPRAPWKVLRQLARWCGERAVSGRRPPCRGPPSVRTAGRAGRRGNGCVPGAGVTLEWRESWLRASWTGSARRCHAPVRCAPGIDPSGELLARWGLHDDAEGLRAFCRTCVDAFSGVVGVVKAQVAFFERHGSAGMAELERLVAEASSAGLVVIADAKRGDIDSTAEAYADAWLNPASPLAADAVTAHPYLGLGALAPLVRLAGAHGRGLLVVARSSNPEGRALQQARTAEGPAVEDMLLAEVAALNAVGRGAEGDGRSRRRRHPSPV